MLEYFSTKRPHILDTTYLLMMSDESIDLPSIACYEQQDGLFEYLPKNIWIGVSVEDQKAADDRIRHLLKVPAAVRFLSCEPLLGPVDLTGNKNGEIWPWMDARAEGHGIDWVIVGGESGPGARPMHPDWATSLRDQCKNAGVPFFFKQWGEWHPYMGDQMEDLFGPDYSFLKYQRFEDNCFTYRVGKKASGRLLDGVLHDEFPKPLTYASTND
jgi:protein gp37